MRKIHGVKYFNESEILEKLDIQEQTFDRIRREIPKPYPANFQRQVSIIGRASDDFKFERRETVFPIPIEICGEELWKVEDVDEWLAANPVFSRRY